VFTGAGSILIIVVTVSSCGGEGGDNMFSLKPTFTDSSCYIF